jgi:hypothetical protein
MCVPKNLLLIIDLNEINTPKLIKRKGSENRGQRRLALYAEEDNQLVLRKAQHPRNELHDVVAHSAAA